MGCTSSTVAAPQPTLLTIAVPLQHKRKKTLSRSLSIINVVCDPALIVSISPVQLSDIQAALVTGNEVRRFTHNLLSNRTAKELCFSIGSRTDTELHRRQPFSSKAIACFGDSSRLPCENFGYACHKGLNTGCPNQDSWLVLRLNDRYSLYGVFDGHGKHGHQISHFVQELLPELILHDARFEQGEMAKLLTDTFLSLHAMIGYAAATGILDATLSGTTTTLVIHDRSKGKLWIAHVGDSAVCMVRRGVDGNVSGLCLTQDHKPSNLDEKVRIEDAGGEVVVEEVARVMVKGQSYPGVKMSRCLGDLCGHAKAGLSAEPEILQYDVSPDDQMLLVCSNGLLEFSDVDKIAKLAMRYKSMDAMACAARLSKFAWDNWIQMSNNFHDMYHSDDEEVEEVVDDITCLCIPLHNDMI